jgi:hypothetical protein
LGGSFTSIWRASTLLGVDLCKGLPQTGNPNRELMAILPDYNGFLGWESEPAAVSCR